MGGPGWGALAVLGTDLGADLGVHQRLGEHPHPFTQEVDIAAVGLAQQLHQFHGGHGHRGSPLDVLITLHIENLRGGHPRLQPGGLLLHQPLGR